MNFAPSIIPAGSITLRGYQENQIYRHAMGVEAYQQLVNYNGLAANKEVAWELPMNFQLQSIWIKCSQLPSETDKVDLLVNSLLARNEFTAIITFNLKAKQIDDQNVWIAWEPPLTILSKELTVKMQATLSTETMLLIGKECYLNPVIYPSTIDLQ